MLVAGSGKLYQGLLKKIHFLRFDHFGEVDSGVEMRAEVGLLSRNVVIRGEMESSCYPPNPCEEVTYDTFGGHIIAKYDCKQGGS